MSIIANLIETMTGAIVDGYVNTGNKADHLQAQENVRTFLYENIGRLELWAKTHPGRRPPVYFNSETGGVVWLSRSQNRKLQRLNHRAQRGRVSSKTSAHSAKSSRSAKSPPK
jgi:hypothetical protein